MNKASYRTILRSSSIIGGAQAANITANLIKIKIVALLLGPVGVGLAGLYVSLIQAASMLGALGLGISGTRRVATAADDAVSANRTRITLFWASIILAVLAAGLFWLGRDLIAQATWGDAQRANEVGWLAIGVGLTIAASAQTALLSGLRSIGDLARVQAGAGIAGAAIGMLAVWLWGKNGLIVMVLGAPLLTLLLGHLYVAKIPRPDAAPPGAVELSREFKLMVALGIPIMLGQLTTLAGQLLVRVLVQRELDTAALGYFQAAWAISVTYLGFVLTAMSTDYFPRLSAALHDKLVMQRLVNEQTEVALLLCSPVLLATLGLAPWIVTLLYSSQFAPAVDILRWQVLGDILRVMSWPLGFVLLAAGSGKTFVCAEVLGIAVFLTGVAFGLPLIGVNATGIAFVVMYVVYLPLIATICARRFGIRWTRRVILQCLCIIVAAVAIFAAAQVSALAGALAGVVLAGAAGLWTIYRVAAVVGPEGKLAHLAVLAERLKQRIAR